MSHWMQTYAQSKHQCIFSLALDCIQLHCAKCHRKAARFLTDLSTQILDYLHISKRHWCVLSLSSG